jgi:hypothetical protein
VNADVLIAANVTSSGFLAHMRAIAQPREGDVVRRRERVRTTSPNS